MEDQDLEYFRGILTQSLNNLQKKGDETVSLNCIACKNKMEAMEKAAGV